MEQLSECSESFEYGLSECSSDNGVFLSEDDEILNYNTNNIGIPHSNWVDLSSFSDEKASPLVPKDSKDEKKVGNHTENIGTVFFAAKNTNKHRTKRIIHFSSTKIDDNMGKKLDEALNKEDENIVKSSKSARLPRSNWVDLSKFLDKEEVDNKAKSSNNTLIPFAKKITEANNAFNRSNVKHFGRS